MEQSLKRLKTLKSVNPDPGYAARARHYILSAPQTGSKPFPFPIFEYLAAKPVFAVVGLVVIFGLGFVLLGGRSSAPMAGNESDEGLTAVEIGLRAKEIGYYQKAFDDISEMSFKIQRQIDIFWDKLAL